MELQRHKSLLGNRVKSYPPYCYSAAQPCKRRVLRSVWYKLTDLLSYRIKEALLKYGAEIAKSDFQANWTKIPQEYCRISRDLSSI